MNKLKGEQDIYLVYSKKKIAHNILINYKGKRITLLWRNMADSTLVK